MSDTIALIVAGGSGSRAGGPVPKQYQRLAGLPVLRRTVLAFRHHPAIDAVRVVIDPAHRALYDHAVGDLGLAPPIVGGSTRQDSVRAGLEALAAAAPARVLIHDAARPFVDAATIDRVLAALEAAAGAVPTRPVVDALQRVVDGHVVEAVDRTPLVRAQTPQGFHFAAILAAHRQAAGLGLADDVAVLRHSGGAVAIVDGAEANVKLTHAEDLVWAARLLHGTETRVGTGFDVHKFGPGDHVMLCGVPVPHEFGLDGHSDADVALHALTDAILGAIGAGDIGEHFPPSDPQWRGAASARFLAHANDLAAARGAVIAHVDVTLIGERPKVAPYRQTMIASLAAILGLPPGRVSVKATTTEGLGFTGRREGLAALATATLRLPADDTP
jgi:2-C-methyl-D-erythritol 4-phosphate cytidylyltransferase/2-C-methyl-D-erythritol 2,4-cyclodiphosphate synthase